MKWVSKKEATRNMLGQISKIEAQNYGISEGWLTQTASYVFRYFGAESPEYNYMKNYSYIPKVTPGMTNDTFQGLLRQNKIEILVFLRNCIETIEKSGVATNRNYLSRLSDTWITTLLFIGAPAIFFAGECTERHVYSIFPSDSPIPSKSVPHPEEERSDERNAKYTDSGTSYEDTSKHHNNNLPDNVKKEINHK